MTDWSKELLYFTPEMAQYQVADVLRRSQQQRLGDTGQALHVRPNRRLLPVEPLQLSLQHLSGAAHTALHRACRYALRATQS